MTKFFDSSQTLKSGEDCGKFSTRFLYKNLVGGTTTNGTGIKQTLCFYGCCANKPLSAVGTLTSLLCNSAKVVEKMLQTSHVLRLVKIISLVAVLSVGSTSESWATCPNGTRGSDDASNSDYCGVNCCWVITTVTNNDKTEKVLTITPALDSNNKPYTNVVMKDFGASFSNSTANTTNDYTSSWSSNAPWQRQGVTSVVVENGISYIGANAFIGDTKITSVKGMENVTSIGREAFRYASSLQSVDMPNVTSIGQQVFGYASSLQSVDMPNVTTIGSEAFESATSLQSVDMPNVTEIGVWAFNGASSLSYVGFDPYKVTFIGNNAFGVTKVDGCSKSNSANCNYCTNSGTNSSNADSNIENSTTMFQPYANGGGGECQASCNGGYTASGSLCKKDSDVTIPENCRTYNNGCTQCSTGYLAKEGGCIEPSACTGEYIVDETNGTCKKMPGCVDYADGACGGCERGFYKKEGGCVSAQEGCGSGYLEKDSVCISSANGCGAGYKDMGGWCNRIRYTPAEAAQVLRDDDKNEIVITFRK